MTRNNILQEIDNERNYQDGKWGRTTDDTLNTPWMWASYISKYATKWMAGTLMPLKPGVTNAFRECMIKTAAIAVAAVESVDRQRLENGRAFYEDE